MKQKFVIFTTSIVAIVITGFILFNACEKDKQVVTPPLDNEPNLVSALPIHIQNQVIDDLAELVAISLDEEEVRKMFKEEISLQFTLDYDILYRFVASKEIESERYGQIRYDDMLERLAQDYRLNFETILKYAGDFKNLQISGSTAIDQWQVETEIPEVISLPVEYNENEEIQLNAYNSKGQLRKITDTEVPTLFLVVRESERVDVNGMIRVDLNSIVIPPEERAMTAETAYELAKNKAVPIITEPLIVKLSENEMTEMLASRSSDQYKVNSLISDDQSVFSENEDEEKATCTSYPAAPVITKIYPKAAGQIEIQWTGPADVSMYEIWRRYRRCTKVPPECTTVTELLTTLGSLSGGGMLVYDDNNAFPGYEFIYTMRSVNSAGCKSASTTPIEVYGSLRTNNCTEKIKRVYISENAWQCYVSPLESKIELQFKGGAYSIPSAGVSRFPSGDLPLSMGQRTRDQQKDKWCDYYKNMFTWDIRIHSYNYRVMLFEDDADGTEITNALSYLYKVGFGFTDPQGGGSIINIEETKGANLQVKYSIKDDFLGEVEVFYYNHPDAAYEFFPCDGTILAIFGQ